MPKFAPLVNGKADTTRTISVSEEHATQVLRPQKTSWKEVFDEKPEIKEVQITHIKEEVLKDGPKRGRPSKNRF